MTIIKPITLNEKGESEMRYYTKKDLNGLSLEQLLFLFPDNYCLYKDSGCWGIFDDDDKFIDSSSEYIPTELIRNFLEGVRYDELKWARMHLITYP